MRLPGRAGTFYQNGGTEEIVETTPKEGMIYLFTWTLEQCGQARQYENLGRRVAVPYGNLAIKAGTRHQFPTSRPILLSLCVCELSWDLFSVVWLGGRESEMGEYKWGYTSLRLCSLPSHRWIRRFSSLS